MAWRQVKVTFIPRPGKLDYTEALAYRPISLSSFILKTMEKLVNRQIRDGALRIYLLHENQFAYQRDKTTETALHNVVTFLDIEGTVDRTSFDTIKQASERHGH
jgi:glycyl-tRNA synthetase (class II)